MTETSQNQHFKIMAQVLRLPRYYIAVTQGAKERLAGFSCQEWGADFRVS